MPRAARKTGVAGCYTTTGALLRDNPGGTQLPANVPGGPCTNLGTFQNGTVVPKDANDTGFTYKANVTWKIDPDHLVYGTVSRGFRPGGINRRAGLDPYASDFLENYELGFKTSWFDRALKINGALFWQDWSAFQFAFLGANSFTEIHNGPNARIKGVEADVNWTAAPGLTFTGAGTYTDAKTRSNLCAVEGTSGDCTTPGTGRHRELHPGPGRHPPADHAAVQDQRRRALRDAADRYAQGSYPGRRRPFGLGRVGHPHPVVPARHRRGGRPGGGHRPAGGVHHVRLRARAQLAVPVGRGRHRERLRQAGAAIALRRVRFVLSTAVRCRQHTADDRPTAGP